MENLVKSDEFGKKDHYSRSVDLKEEYISRGVNLPTRVIIKKGDVIDAVSFSYNKGNQLLIGGKGGGQESFALAQDEYIVGASGGYTSDYYGKMALTSLYFKTNRGRVLGAHGNKSDETHFDFNAPAGMAICCLFGSYSIFSDFAVSIGFYSRSYL